MIYVDDTSLLLLGHFKRRTSFWIKHYKHMIKKIFEKS